MWAVSIHPTSLSINWSDLFARARARCGMKHETLARLMGISATQLSQQLGGNGHVSLFRLVQVAADRDGKRFLIELFSLLGHDLGFHEVDPLLETLAQMMTVTGTLLGKLQLRMAKADLRDTEYERRQA